MPAARASIDDTYEDLHDGTEEPGVGGQQAAHGKWHRQHPAEEICDAAAIMDHGQVVAAGSMEELTSAAKEIRILVASSPLPMDEIRSIPLRFGPVLVVALDEYTSAYGASSAEFGWLEQTLS